EVLDNPGIVGQPERYNRYVNIVKDEIGRLQRQVEMVLTTAIAEKNMLDIKPEPIEAHREIASLLEKYNSKITVSLQADNDLIKADRDHFRGLISNLLDNAIKY